MKQNAVYDAERLRKMLNLAWLNATQIDLKLSEFRHLSVKLLRANIDYPAKNDLQDLLETQAGHSVETGCLVYGRSSLTGGKLTHELLEDYYKVSRGWHTYLGLE